MTNVEKKIEITGYTPIYNAGNLKVLVLAGRMETEHVIPFAEIAREIYPNGNGDVIDVRVCAQGSEIIIPISAAGFIYELLFNIKDPIMKQQDRAPYVVMFDDVLIAILERRAAA